MGVLRRSGTGWFIDETEVTATAAEINAIAGGGLSSAELGVLDGVTPGTATASKALVLDSGKAIATITSLTATTLIAAANAFVRGVVVRAQGAPAAKTVTAAISAAELVGGLITTTGATGPSVHQLPTGTEIDAALSGIATGDSFDFTLINTGTGASDDATITVNTDVTIVGNPTVGALTDATIISGSGTFRARRTAANTYVVYRLA